MTPEASLLNVDEGHSSRGNTKGSMAGPRHPGYAISQRVRKRVEEIRLDQDGGRRNLKPATRLTVAAYNLVRMTKLAPNPG